MAAKKPLISVIIPAYNEEHTIGACLESIARQDIKDKIEVIIVDDDSTDRTLEIAKSYAKKLTIKTVRNGTKNPERGKRIGLDHAKGKFFMYCDADMSFRDGNWFSEMIRPLAENKKVAGCLASFGVNPKDNALTRCISYDIFQRDPIFAAFTPSIKSTIIKKENGYYICKFSLEKIPAQSLCLYRTLLLKKIFKSYYMLMDNDIPVILVKKGWDLFAFNPRVRVYHFLLKNLGELWRKRIRGVTKTYMNNLPKREYRWFNLKKKSNVLLLGLYVIYANLFIPAFFYGLYKSIKYRDNACLYEPLITLVSTDALISGFFKSKRKMGDLLKT